MRKLLLCAALLLPAHLGWAQRKAIFFDSLGQVTTFELHWAQVVTGRYKTQYDRPSKRRTLVRTTPQEFRDELAKTEKRITWPQPVGQPFEAFHLPDLAGQPCRLTDLRGKIVVLNFWFVGCGPCEMERPALNELVQRYRADSGVVFVSLAASPIDKLRPFLLTNPFAYRVLPTDLATVKQQFGAFGYPRSVVIGRDSRVVYNCTGTGVGITQILQREIERARRL